MSREDPKDIRGLLGMHTTAAKAAVGVYVVLITIVTLNTWQGVRVVWPSLLALVLLAAATIALVAAPGDPLPPVATTAMTLAGPVASALTLAAVPAPLEISLQGWTHGGATTVYCFLCVRGRARAAWLGLLAVTVVYMVWSARTGQGALTGFAMCAIEIGPLGMATVLSCTLRPDAAETFELRAAAATRHAEESAAAAVLQERDEQLGRLDRLARPLLTRIASGERLTPAECLNCELLEAHLRDRLRAPGLTDADTSARVRTARRRGVEVVLIDDHGMDTAEPVAAERVRAAVTAALDRADARAVRIRILPPGRPALASILERIGDDVRRTEYDHRGLPVPGTNDAARITGTAAVPEARR